MGPQRVNYKKITLKSDVQQIACWGKISALALYDKKGYAVDNYSDPGQRQEAEIVEIEPGEEIVGVYGVHKDNEVRAIGFLVRGRQYI